MTTLTLLYAVISIGFGITLLRRKPAIEPVSPGEDGYDSYLLDIEDSTFTIATRANNAEPDIVRDEYSALLSSTSFFGRAIAPALRTVARGGGHLLPGDYRSRTEKRLLVAGLAKQLRAEELIAGQIVTAIMCGTGGVGLAAMSGWQGRLVWLTAAVTAWLGVHIPSSWGRRQIESREFALRRDLPNVIDLLRVAVLAGSSLEQGLQLVINDRDGALAEEFRKVLDDTTLGYSRSQALIALRERVQLFELTNMISALLQAEELGMPLARVLEVQANELRLRRTQYAREQAGKLPVKVLFPLVLFIFPPILIITLGPAAASISKAL